MKKGGVEMENLKRKPNKYRNMFMLFVFISIFMFSGCSFEKKGQNIEKQKNELHNESSEEDFKINSLDILEGEFEKAIGWLDNETIVYIANVQQASNVYKYHLPTGRSTLLYKSNLPIITVYISPSRERMLIHSSGSSNEGVLTILTAEGDELVSQSIESFELAFEWNPYNENLLLVSSFTEQWDFQSYILNIEEKELSKIQLQEPFASWLSEDEFIYLDWEKDHSSLLAPLKKVRYKSGEIETIMTDLYHVKAFKDNIMTIGLSKEQAEKAVYSFFSPDLKIRSSVNVPLLSTYSDWLVPYFDMNPEHKLFYTFRPRASGNADTYKEGFDFISFDIETGEETVILENGENEPVSCSPNGKLCLYGYQLEKIIHIRKKNVFSLLETGS
jgi:hypothetical protein